MWWRLFACVGPLAILFGAACLMFMCPPRHRKAYSSLGHIPAEIIRLTISDNRIYVGGWDGIFRILDRRTGNQVGQFGTRMALQDFCLDPEGSLLGAVYNDNSIRVWSTRNGALTAAMTSRFPAYSISFTKSGHLVVAGKGNEVSLYDARTGALEQQLLLENACWIRSLAVSDDTVYAADGGGLVIRSDSNLSRVSVFRVDTSIECLIALQSGKEFFFGDHKGSIFFGSTDPHPLLFATQRGRATCLSISPCERCLACGTRTLIKVGGPKGMIVVYDLKTRIRLREVSLEKCVPSSMIWDDGRLIAGCTNGEIISIPLDPAKSGLQGD